MITQKTSVHDYNSTMLMHLPGKEVITMQREVATGAFSQIKKTQQKPDGALNNKTLNGILVFTPNQEKQLLSKTHLRYIWVFYFIFS